MAAKAPACAEVSIAVEQGNVIAVSTGLSVAASRGDKSIGTILIQAGRLTLNDAERVLDLQREQGLRFGEAAIQLGLLTPSDIEFALARQFDYPYLAPGDSKVDESSVISAYLPMSPTAQAISALRGQLMLRWFDGDAGRKAMAIISAERGEGRSFMAANLAVSFSQLGQKTLLIDADMRHPVQHALFDVDNRCGLSALLSERADMTAVVRPVAGLPDLSVVPAGVLPPNPLELLARRHFSRALLDYSKAFDVVILDTPPAADFPDAQGIAVRAGAALLVARKNVTRMWKVRGISDKVTHASATILGSVLNEF